MAATTTTAALQRTLPSPSSAKHTSSTAVLADLLRGAGNASTTARESTRCPLFPTESEDYYCLSCYARCSGLSLLVGPHTNHDHLPLKDALLYMPAALLRETQEVVRESQETFAKPWRVQEQQREETLHYLLNLRQGKLAAIAQLMEDLQRVDEQLLHATEAKALDLSNWRYQQRALRRKLEKLKCGADTLSNSIGTNAGAPVAPVSSASSEPSWQHRLKVTQQELTQVRSLLRRQLEQLEEDEEAALHQLATWRRLLEAVPQGRTDASANTAVDDACKGWSQPKKPANSFSDNAPARPWTNAREVRLPSPRPAPLTPDTKATQPSDSSHLHPSDAEVVLLQHALLSINDGLRHRLLRAAAASLTSSSASASTTSSRSRLPSSSRDAMTPAGTVTSNLPPLPGETPLRDATSGLHHHAQEGKGGDEGRERLAEELQHSPPPRSSTRAAMFGMVDTPVAAAAPQDTRSAREEDVEAGRRHNARWQSLQAQDRALKDSLDQLLNGGTTTTTANGNPMHTSASSSFAPELFGGEYGTVSAMSGPISSISALQQCVTDY